MAKRLFVGGLPYSTTSDELKDLFSKAGEIESVSVITDKFTGQGKGFAFVEMKTDAEAENAIKTLNGTELGGRKIVVAEARPLEERKPGGFNGRFDRGGRRSDYGRGRGKRW